VNKHQNVVFMTRTFLPCLCGPYPLQTASSPEATGRCPSDADWPVPWAYLVSFTLANGCFNFCVKIYHTLGLFTSFQMIYRPPFTTRQKRCRPGTPSILSPVGVCMAKPSGRYCHRWNWPDSGLTAPGTGCRQFQDKSLDSFISLKV